MNSKEQTNDPLPLDLRVTFKVDVRAKTVGVEPMVFLQRLGGGVEFVAEGLLDDYTLELDFKTQHGTRGPFKKGAGPRGRYTLTASRPSVPSESADQTGVWKYEVVLRDRDSNDVVAIDPMGVLK